MTQNSSGAAKTSKRAQAQRERILAAAQKCFVESGFHAASMASISEAAGMSPGLIYRYFENKNSIILAIIERQLKEGRADIAALRSDTDLAPRIIELFRNWQRNYPDTMSAPLFLEMTVEASRNPQVAEALRASDAVIGNDFIAWMKRTCASHGVHLSDEAVKWRAFSLKCFIEGLAIRAVREPDLDMTVLHNSLNAVLPLFFPLADQTGD